MRLDIALVARGFFESRTRAARAIREGMVKVNGIIRKKSSDEVSEADMIEAEDPLPYVSRGGLKLCHAMRQFQINVTGMRAIDIGASTGGFTEVLLARGAAEVVCVDVGSGQLAPKLRKDKRVVNLEKTDIRNFPVDRYPPFAFACVDVSFISLNHILPFLNPLLISGGRAVCLVKPQFEVGRQYLNKKGVVKDPARALAAAEAICTAAEQNGFQVIGLTASPIKGGDGNTEYLMALLHF